MKVFVLLVSFERKRKMEYDVICIFRDEEVLRYTCTQYDRPYVGLVGNFTFKGEYIYTYIKRMEINDTTIYCYLTDDPNDPELPECVQYKVQVSYYNKEGKFIKEGAYYMPPEKFMKGKKCVDDEGNVMVHNHIIKKLTNEEAFNLRKTELINGVMMPTCII